MIRRAIDGDCTNLSALAIHVWLGTYAIDGFRHGNSKYALSRFTESYFSDLLRNSQAVVLVNIEGIYLRGFIVLDLTSKFEERGSDFEVQTLYVHEMFRGHGIGRSLLNAAGSGFGNRFWLHTWDRNAQSLSFYRRYGFKDIGKRVIQLDSGSATSRVLEYTPT